jgi:hypothetical protein
VYNEGSRKKPRKGVGLKSDLRKAHIRNVKRKQAANAKPLE